MKKEDVLFKLAKTEVNKFARNVLEDCFDLANDYDYEKEWVVDMFQEEFSKVKREVLK